VSSSTDFLVFCCGVVTLGAGALAFLLYCEPPREQLRAKAEAYFAFSDETLNNPDAPLASPDQVDSVLQRSLVRIPLRERPDITELAGQRNRLRPLGTRYRGKTTRYSEREIMETLGSVKTRNQGGAGHVRVEWAAELHGSLNSFKLARAHRSYELALQCLEQAQALISPGGLVGLGVMAVGGTFVALSYFLAYFKR